MNRRNEIIETASRLFAQQGYHATSIRAITADVGCQGSAIYCHFEQGKQELLHTILSEHMPDFEEVNGECIHESTAEKAFDELAQRLANLAHTDLQEWQWVAGEFPALPPGERSVVRARLAALHGGLVECLLAHTGNNDFARTAAWLLIALTAGYAQLVRLLGPDLGGGTAQEQFVSALKNLLRELSSNERSVTMYKEEQV